MPDLMTAAEVARIAKLMSEPVKMNDADIRAIALAKGVVPTALYDIAVRFPNDGSVALDTWLDDIRKEAPHYWPPRDETEDVDKALVLAACGPKPTLAARAALRAAAGAELYSKILTAWGCSERTLSPGTNPKNVTDGTEKKSEERAAKRPDASNPWCKLGWNISAQGRLVVALGAEKAAQIAASAGCRIGSTKPNPDFN